MSALFQGILANNSISPDVEIKEFGSDTARIQLKGAISKTSLAGNKQHYNSLNKKCCKIVRPNILEKQVTSNLATENLALEIAKLSTKLDSIEKNAKIAEITQRDERTLELEKKMNRITDERLQYLEKLQHEQEQWKKQYFQTICKMNEIKTAPVITSKLVPQYDYCQITSDYPIKSNDVVKKQNILQTPVPRKNIPQPTTSDKISSGHFLQDILDQYNVSTPDLSHVNRVGPIDTIPVRLTNEQIPTHVCPASTIHPIPSPIKPSVSQLIAKEVEYEAERQKISEKFPHSISEYLPLTHVSPVAHILTSTVPQSSLVTDFRCKLRKLIEQRSNLEKNLQAVQKKPKLNNFASAALLDQLGEDNHFSFSDEKLCWIQKLVDDQITLNTDKVKEEVAEELKTKKLKKTTQSNFNRRQKLKRESTKYNDAVKPIPKLKKFIKKKDNHFLPSEVNDFDESFITHVYGKAEYHPHRTTVHKPFMHMSPVKSPKFRTKRALQSVPASYVRSEKTQTNLLQSSPTFLRSKYFAPTAISLGPPRVHENEPDPVILPAPKPTPIKPKSVQVDIPDESCCLPGCVTIFEPNISECSCEEEEVQVDGESYCPFIQEVTSPVKCPLTKQKPSPVKCKLLKSPEKCKLLKKDGHSTGSVCPLENVKCWVEQEIMSKILQQLYAGAESQGTQTVNMETDFIKTAIEDEILKLIRDKILNRLKKEAASTPHVVPITPLPTPQPTPETSISEKNLLTSVATPMLTPAISESESDSTIPESMKAPSVSQEEKEFVILPTPSVTPTASPEVSIKEESEKSASFTDPWEGKSPDEEFHMLPSGSKIPLKLAPDPEAVDLVVRTVTPPPVPKNTDISLSESSTTDSSKSEDRTISQGQLLIEHGEMKPKVKLPIKIPSNLEDLVNQSTLKDVADFEPLSEGEFRPSARPPVIPKQMNFVEDDPTSIYARPRKPGIFTPEPDDLSVGEIPGKQRNRFDRWKASKQNSKTSLTLDKADNEVPLAVDDLDATSVESPSLSEGLVANVIRVTASRPQTEHVIAGNQTVNETSDPINNVARPKNQMVLNLPNTDPISAASDTEDISVQDF